MTAETLLFFGRAPEALPLYDLGLSWVLPAVVFGLAAQLVTMLPSVRRREELARRAGEKN